MNEAAVSFIVEVDDRAVVREFHARLRKEMNDCQSRYLYLLWGYVRGFPFRRVERTHHKQIVDGVLVEQLPSARDMSYSWKSYLPSITREEIEVWLNNPDGAIPQKARVKKVYTKSE